MKRVIFYLIDGARPDILQKLVGEGRLPNIQEILFNKGSFTVGTSCLPSTTGPAYLPFLTGTYPGNHHITGIRWFDKSAYFRTSRWSRSATRSYCGYEAKYFNDDMRPEHPSLFELIPNGVNIYNMITKGVAEENDITKKGKAGLYFNAHFYHRHHEVDLAGHQKLMESLSKNSPFTFAVFPSIDWDSHTYHYESDQTIRAYEIVDQSLGELHQQLENKGIIDDSLILMASDHGLSATHTHLDLGKFFKERSYTVLEYPNFSPLKPKIAVFISGNSFATLSFLDHPELYHGTPLIRKHGSILSEFLKEEAIDFITMRESDDRIRIMNEEGYALISYSETTVSYYPESADPLALGDRREKLSDTESFDLCYASDYPDSLTQIVQLTRSPRSGDVCVYARPGFDLRDFWEIPEHKGSHGSLCREHMYIPILSNKENGISEPVRSTALFHQIRNWLSI